MTKLSDYVFTFLTKKNIKRVFVLPGGGCMHLVDSLGRCRHIRPVCCLHEQAVTIAAEAEGQYSNNFGVALVTTGPGGTNTITGVAGAWIDSTPLLVISGQVKRCDMIKNSGVRQKGIQEVDIISIVRPITKYAVTVFNPASIKYHLEKAIYYAKTGRPGPVWLDIPLDVQGTLIDENKLKGFSPPKPKAQRGLSKLVDKTIQLVNKSERPVILVGNGVRLSGGLKEFITLIKILKMPVLTTWKTIDFLPENHPLFFGRPGSIAQRGANFIQQNSDFILTIGARLDLAQVGYNYKNFACFAKKVVVDIDPNEIKKIKTKIDIAICADAKRFLSEFIQKKNSIQSKDRDSWLSRCLQWKKRYPVTLAQYSATKGCINSYVLVDVLSDLMTNNDILVPGSSGTCSEITMQAFKVKKGQRILNTPGLGSMGFGLPASIGACLASGRKRTVGIIGDGGLQHNIQELETMARLKLPIKLFILNNGGYASIRTTQKTHFKGHYVCCDPSSGLTFPEIEKISSAYGIKFFKLRDHKKIRDEIKEILDYRGPVICEVITDPVLSPVPKISSQVLKNGSIVSKPLEDLYPFLDRDEFEANMIVKPVDE
jgi:acetolactate synthase-1/2/3 large subunit